MRSSRLWVFFFQAEDGIRDHCVTGVQTCALPISLPVQIAVQISLSEVPGLRTGSIDVVQVPAASRRQVRIPTEVIRAGQFSVEAQLSTPGGTPLGPPAASRIQLRSTAYGTVTLALTGGGAILLVLLAGLRITRRV